MMSATFDIEVFIKYFELRPDYRDVGLVLPTKESIAMKYENQKNWVTCDNEHTILFPDQPPIDNEKKIGGQNDLPKIIDGILIF